MQLRAGREARDARESRSRRSAGAPPLPKLEDADVRRARYRRRRAPGLRLAGPGRPDRAGPVPVPASTGSTTPSTRDRIQVAGRCAEVDLEVGDLDLELQVRVRAVGRRVDDELGTERQRAEIDDEARDLARVQELDVRREGDGDLRPRRGHGSPPEARVTRRRAAVTRPTRAVDGRSEVASQRALDRSARTIESPACQFPVAWVEISVSG